MGPSSTRTVAPTMGSSPTRARIAPDAACRRRSGAQPEVTSRRCPADHRDVVALGAVAVGTRAQAVGALEHQRRLVPALAVGCSTPAHRGPCGDRHDRARKGRARQVADVPRDAPERLAAGVAEREVGVGGGAGENVDPAERLGDPGMVGREGDYGPPAGQLSR